VVQSLNFLNIIPMYENNILWRCHLSYKWNLLGLNIYRLLRVEHCIYQLRILDLKIKRWCCGLCSRNMWRSSCSFKEVEKRWGFLCDSCKDCSLNSCGGKIRFDPILTLYLATWQLGDLNCWISVWEPWSGSECHTPLCVHEGLNWWSFTVPSFTLVS
jgi:hypothetical protein